MSEEAEALESLVKSPGWAWLRAQVTEEWSARKEQGLKEALSNTDDAQSLNKLRQIQAAEAAVQYVLALPVRRLALLRQASTTSSVERRGGL